MTVMLFLSTMIAIKIKVMFFEEIVISFEFTIKWLNTVEPIERTQ